MYERLKALRQEKGLSRAEMAERLGVSADVVRNAETGRSKCSVDYVVRCADFFDVPTDYLLGRTDERVPKGWK